MSSKIHGIAISIASLKREKPSLIGEYLDLIPFIDWISSVGMKAIQILPINDSGNDPSPYNGKSAYALSPLYLRVPGLEWGSVSTHVDFPEVIKRKKETLKKDFEKSFTSLKKELSFQQFLEAQKNWIEDFALHNEGDFTLYEQYLCYEQMGEAASYAVKKGILIVGDLPILLSPDSAEVRRFPELFSHEFVTGAPPDQFSKEGQKWGFPLYRWDVVEKGDLSFWKERLAWSRQFFATFRLDHIIGFFRLWAIPKDKKAQEGFYIPENEEEAIAQGRRILKTLVKQMAIPFIGEDLGVIPTKAREVMQELGIPSMKVMRWERKWHGDQSYIPMDQYPEVSLTCVSTHDTEPLRLWWKNNPDERAAFCAFKGWQESDELTSIKILEILEDAHKSNSRYHINLLLEYLSAFPEFSYEDLEADRINIPGIISPKNWGWRMRPSIEDLFEATKLNQALAHFSRL